MDKQALRDRFRRVREQLSAEEVRAASVAVCRRLAGWEVAQRARIVLTYLAFRNEIDLSALVKHLPGVRWALPRVDGPCLVLHPYDRGRLIRHRFGMLEPAADLPVIPASEIDVVLVPGVAFDRHGARLGFGGGYYDRFLPTTPALRVGIAHDLCLADELPCTERDQRVDWVITPTRAVTCRAAIPVLEIN